MRSGLATSIFPMFFSTAMNRATDIRLSVHIQVDALVSELLTLEGPYPNAFVSSFCRYSLNSLLESAWLTSFPPPAGRRAQVENQIRRRRIPGRGAVRQLFPFDQLFP